MTPAQQIILDYLKGATSASPRTAPEIYTGCGGDVKSILIQPALDFLFEKGYVNRCQVIKSQLNYMQYWPTGFKGPAMTKDPIPTFGKEPKVKPLEPASWAALKQSKSENTEDTDMANKPFKASQVRDLIDATGAKGIELTDLLSQLLKGSTDKLLTRKAVDMINYVAGYGGYTKTSPTVGTKYYFKTELMQPTNTDKAAPAKPEVLGKSEPALTNPHKVENYKSAVFNEILNTTFSTGETPVYPSIKINLQIEIPPMPDMVKIKGLRKANLDDAFNGGEDYNIDIAMLDDLAVHSFISEWTMRFKQHVEARRQSSINELTVKIS